MIKYVIAKVIIHTIADLVVKIVFAFVATQGITKKLCSNIVIHSYVIIWE